MIPSNGDSYLPLLVLGRTSQKRRSGTGTITTTDIATILMTRGERDDINGGGEKKKMMTTVEGGEDDRIPMCGIRDHDRLSQAGEGIALVALDALDPHLRTTEAWRDHGEGVIMTVEGGAQMLQLILNHPSLIDAEGDMNLREDQDHLLLIGVEEEMLPDLLSQVGVEVETDQESQGYRWPIEMREEMARENPDHLPLIESGGETHLPPNLHPGDLSEMQRMEGIGPTARMGITMTIEMGTHATAIMADVMASDRKEDTPRSRTLLKTRRPRGNGNWLPCSRMPLAWMRIGRSAWQL